MVLSFLRNRRARLGSYFSRTQSSKSVRHRSTVASSAFCVIVFINLLKLMLNQGLPEPDFILPSKTVHRRFSFPRVTLLSADFVGLWQRPLTKGK